MADDEKRDEAGRFVTGTKPGPGRPKGSKSKLTEDFFADLASAWETHGKPALQQMVAEHPEKFVQTVAGLMPKDANITTENTIFVVSDNPMSEDEWQETFVASPAGTANRTH